jgi:DNA-binding GntR family transcriptional regulator
MATTKKPRSAKDAMNNTTAKITMAATAPKRRAADVAYETLETFISTLQLQPGAQVVEAELVQRTGLGRTPLREALLRMVSTGLIVQQPRRGLLISTIDLADHLDVVQTRRVLECLIAACSARRATEQQRKDIVLCAQRMVRAAAADKLDDYMQADIDLDRVNHTASQNHSAVKAVVPLIVQCRRFWYAYRHAGDTTEGAAAHMQLAEGIASGDEAAAIAGAARLSDYLQGFTERVIAN